MSTDTLNPDEGASARHAAAAPAASPSRRVIDAPTRALHWLLAAAFAGAWLTAEEDGLRAVHATLGYAAGALVGLRVLWGLFGPQPARLRLLGRRVAGLSAWLHGLKDGRLGATQAYSVFNGLAALGILALVLATAVVGTLAFNFAPTEGLADALGEVHEALANVVLAVVLAHVALVAGAAVFLKLPRWRAMLTGRVGGSGPDLVQRNRGAWALLLIGGVAGFLAWQFSAGEARWAQPGPGAQLAFVEHGKRGEGRDAGAAGGEERAGRGHTDDADDDD